MIETRNVAPENENWPKMGTVPSFLQASHLGTPDLALGEVPNFPPDLNFPQVLRPLMETTAMLDGVCQFGWEQDEISLVGLVVEIVFVTSLVVIFFRGLCQDSG